MTKDEIKQALLDLMIVSDYYTTELDKIAKSIEVDRIKLIDMIKNIDKL